MPVPYRLETARTVIRCYDPADAPLLKTAVDANLEHLRPWMPWARQDPEPLEAKVELLRRFRGNFDLDQDYTYGIFAADEQTLIGGTGLHQRIGPRALEIGYWIALDQQGRGLVTEVVAALAKAAFTLHGVRRVEIHCDPANTRSAAVPARLGFVHEATLRQRELMGELRDTMVWTLFREAYEAGPLPATEVRCFDARGLALACS